MSKPTCTTASNSTGNRDVEAFLKKFSNVLENLTWFCITDSILGKRAKEKAEKLVECDLCGEESRSEETKPIRLCAKCSSDFITYMNFRRIQREVPKNKFSTSQKLADSDHVTNVEKRSKANSNATYASQIKH